VPNWRTPVGENPPKARQLCRRPQDNLSNIFSSAYLESTGKDALGYFGFRCFLSVRHRGHEVRKRVRLNLRLYLFDGVSRDSSRGGDSKILYTRPSFTPSLERHEPLCHAMGRQLHLPYAYVRSRIARHCCMNSGAPRLRTVALAAISTN
jgi:hypothetical protein